MSQFPLDLVYSLRTLSRRPAAALAAILAVGLGIGATTAIFSVVNAVLLRALPYQKADELVVVFESNTARGEAKSRVSPPLILDWREQSETFAGVEGLWLPQVKLTRDNGEPEVVKTAEVTAGLFSMLGVKPQMGRLFEPAEEGPGSPRLVVLSHGFWQRYFGGEATALGKTLNLDGQPYEVIGVLPRGATYPDRIELWRTVMLNPLEISRHARFLTAVARLAPGVSVEQAQTRLKTVSDRLAEGHPDSNSGWGAALVPLREEIVGTARTGLWVLFVAAALILLIATVNVANLLFARASGRQNEVTLRAALGASRADLMRPFLFEGNLLTLSGGLLALLLLGWSIGLLVAAIPAELPRLDDVAVDWRVVVFTLTLILLTGCTIGILPGLRLTRRSRLHIGTREEIRGGGRRMRSASWLLVAQIAIATVVLNCAGLLAASYLKLISVDPGFKPESLLSFKLDLPEDAYPLGSPVPDFFTETFKRIDAVPGVTSAAAVSFLPLDPAAWQLPLKIEDRPPTEEEITAQYLSVSNDYFQTMGITLEEGRGFESLDHARAAGVVVINRTMAKRYWPEGNALNATITPGGRNFGSLGYVFPPNLKVVGIVADVKNAGIKAAVQPAMFFSYQQFFYRSMNIVVRTNVAPLNLVSPIRQQIRGLDATLPLANISTGSRMIDQAVAQQRFNMRLLGVFAGLGLLLAAIGIYGVLAHNVADRSREIGLRMAIGEQPSGIRKLFLRQGVVLTLLGFGIGLVGSLIAGRWLTTMLFGVRPTDPATLLAIALVLAAAAGLATFIPARRATQVDPALVLRGD